MTFIGICAPRSATKSMCPDADQRIQRLRAEVADLRLERRDLARGEHPGQQLAMNVVDRRVLHDEQAGRDVEVGLDQLEDDAARRTECAVVDEPLVDIGEPAQRVEIVLGVVVQRRLFA